MSLSAEKNDANIHHRSSQHKLVNMRSVETGRKSKFKQKKLLLKADIWPETMLKQSPTTTDAPLISCNSEQRSDYHYG